ncbi:uncharacterized protein LOC130050790 [Ostrea edulis]|uniref:uncharacterized protein LOC130050790 n=1 Tax=Ostrea edulis TaxID=37623 RepID=UPI0024AEB43E|nr:uncharacterized protein LOC130050790 [Ostrea edulis]
MIIVVTLLCILSLHTSQCVSFRYTNTSCLETYKQNRTNMDKITYTGEHVVNHCIPDDQHKEVEVCVRWKWITPDYCPYYDKFSDAIKEVPCSFYCLWNEDLHDVCTCPSRKKDACINICKDVFGSYMYIFCEVSSSVTPKNSMDSQKDKSGVYIWVALCIIVAVILLVGFLICKIRRQRQGNEEYLQGDVKGSQLKIDEGGREDDGSDESDNVTDDLLSDESVNDEFRFLSEDYISSPKEKQNVTENEEKDQYGRTDYDR